jgi:two-component system NtrC family sensor kinase
MDREKEPLDIQPILVGIVEELQPRHEEKKQNFVFECPDKLSTIFGNPLRLRQAFINLIDNAIKYTPEGGDILVSANTTGDHVIVLVRDSGVGIQTSAQPHIFEQYYRADSVSTSHEGTGLGLAIVKSIIEAHGGRIWSESKEKEGATFTIMLPTYKTGEGLTESPHAP